MGSKGSLTTGPAKRDTRHLSYPLFGDSDGWFMRLGDKRHLTRFECVERIAYDTWNGRKTRVRVQANSVRFYG